MTKNSINFDFLVNTIQSIHEEFSRRVAKAINISLTLRNWLVGFYIQEYEQNGLDKAQYGAEILEKLASKLPKQLGFSYRSLRLFRQFYRQYPWIWQSVIAKLDTDKNAQLLGRQPLAIGQNWQSTIANLLKDKLAQIPPPRPFTEKIDPHLLLERLSFTHLTELMKIEDPLKRSFFEMECIKGNWSVRELKRQIASLLFERSGLSKNKKALSAHTQKSAESDSTVLTIKDTYVFEFLGLQSKEVMYESDLEQSLLDKIQDFLLELGHGFCFEARQKRIVIGEEYFFVDLVFYHRILKCHVLIELKTDAFKHEHSGQLNTYLNWYRKNEIQEHDNPPIGILLCTEKNHPLVEYALAGMDNQLFVSKYQLELPKKEEIAKFLEEQVGQLKGK